jgi:hypothetical protein
MGHVADGTALMQRAAGIEMLRGHHEAGLELMQKVLERVEATGGTVVRAREGLLQAALLAAGGLVHEAWDRVSGVREWLATTRDEEENGEVLDDLALTCQLQCAGLHLLGDHSEAVVAPMIELIATCDSQEEPWHATQSARVSLAAALTSLGRAEEATQQLMAIEAHLEVATAGWFNAVIMAGRLGQRALGEAIMSGATSVFQRTGALGCSAIEIALEACAAWLAFTSGQDFDRDPSEGLAKRAAASHDYEVLTIIHLLDACYAADKGDEARAQTAVHDAVEVARRHWTMDELGLMWGVLLPPSLRYLARSLLEADRLQHVN